MDVCERPTRLVVTMTDEDGETVIEARLTAEADKTRLVIEDRAYLSASWRHTEPAGRRIWKTSPPISQVSRRTTGRLAGWSSRLPTANGPRTLHDRLAGDRRGPAPPSSPQLATAERAALMFLTAQRCMSVRLSRGWTRTPPDGPYCRVDGHWHAWSGISLVPSPVGSSECCRGWRTRPHVVLRLPAAATALSIDARDGEILEFSRVQCAISNPVLASGSGDRWPLHRCDIRPS